jgi:cytochrome bd ubiquinol oxidase subunit I
VLEGLWLLTRDSVYRELYQFWLPIFAVSFGMGVVSGIVMSYQFGTNWARMSDAVGAVMGPVMSYEVLTAFFLEAGFLGIMLFGWKRVGEKAHFFATCMVALGTFFSAFWILSANSWMHTPAGYTIVEGRFEPADWWQIVFNPSFPYRLVHTVLGAYLTTAFVVGGVGAWHLLKGHWDGASQRMFSMAMWMAALVAPLQAVAGDFHGLNTLEHQPAKIAAMEALWETKKGAPLVLLAFPNEETRSNDFAIEVPKLASLILVHDRDGEVRGLNDFEDHPPVAPVFWAFRVMVGTGVLMLGLSWLGTMVLRRAQPRWLLWSFAAFTFSGWVATLAGWLVTEIGRQPWLVTGILRTAEAAGEASGGQLGASLTAYVLTYAVLLLSYIIVITHLAGKGSQ